MPAVGAGAVMVVMTGMAVAGGGSASVVWKVEDPAAASLGVDGGL